METVTEITNAEYVSTNQLDILDAAMINCNPSYCHTPLQEVTPWLNQ